ncbi:ribonuclease HI family protein [Ligilactobacillus sp. WILCCON 0076]|uniref:Ribonuclease HI family protein n=1 Tax=Ligilactobacillus ubinensis TaxID=2876789 RepID=A0A9X2FHB7_9LACO|nr:ribonuclease HI family protein [Ligilactobacillus ubinensis]MCP0886172.1 ribonuclease HI family protein [Ligilactobacillus ubinensis]
MIKLYTDAATRKDLSSAGILIIHKNIQLQLKYPLKAMDNHEAEFLAVIKGLTETLAQFNSTEAIFLYSDSKIVIDSINKQYSKHYSTQLQQILLLLEKFSLVTYQWIPEKQNQGAHTLALQALHAQNS